MKISAELSLYPLDAEYKPVIVDYINVLEQSAGLEVRTHALRTEIFGEYETVMTAVKDATKSVFESSQAVVLVAKYLNRDRRDD